MSNGIYHGVAVDPDDPKAQQGAEVARLLANARLTQQPDIEGRKANQVATSDDPLLIFHSLLALNSLLGTLAIALAQRQIEESASDSEVLELAAGIVKTLFTDLG